MKKITILSLLIMFAFAAQSQVQNQNPTQNVCAGTTENYKVTTTLTGSLFAWSITPSSAGTISTTANANEVNILWSTTPVACVVEVIETSSNGCVGNPITVAVTIVPPPTANAGTNQARCVLPGTIINLSGIVTFAASQTWTTNGAGTINNPTTLTPTYTVAAADTLPGSHIITFTLTATPANSPCSVNAVSTITYTFTAPPILTLTNNNPVCETFNVNLGSNISGATYTWSGPAASIGTTQNPVINAATPAMSGIYTLNLTNDPLGCPNQTATTTVVVNPKPATSPIWHN